MAPTIDLAELILTDPAFKDLRAIRVDDLFASVGTERDPEIGWLPVGTALDHPRIPLDGRERILRAFEIRARRRTQAISVEQERSEARHTLPEPALVPLWTELCVTRAQLRRQIAPEGEAEALSCWRLDERAGRVELEGEGITVGVTVLDGFQLRTPFGGARWGLAAVDRLLDALADPKSDLRAALVRLLAQPSWPRALQRLDEGIERWTAAEALLGWRVQADPRGRLSIRPASCAPRPRGGWSVKALRWSDLTPAMMTSASDDRVADLLRWSHHASSELVAVAAEALVGHPRVFSGSKGGRPLSVRKGELALRIVSDQGRIEPRLEVCGQPVPVAELAGHLRAQDGATWLRLIPGEGSDELQIVPLRRVAAAVLEQWLSCGASMPIDAMSTLAERLPALMGLVPVRMSGALRGEALIPDQRPLIRVRWDGGTLELDVRIRPIPELPPLEPGAGLPELLTVRDGRPCHVARELEAEPSRIEAALAPLGLEDAERSGWRWTVSERERALGVLCALAEAEGAYQIAWEGSPPRIHRVRGREVKLRVRSGRGWFALEGRVEVGGARVSLEAVLEAVREGAAFVPVQPGVFARIADELRVRLFPVAAAEDEGRLSALHAPALEALAELEVEIASDEVFQASLDRLRASTSLAVPVPEGLRAELRPYQREGLEWLARLGTWAPGAVLADDMGLGKTVQAIALLCHRAQAGPALVVCPLSVASNWAAELARFSPGLRVVRYRGPGRAALLRALGPGDVALTTWDLLARDPELSEIHWSTAVLDEAQAIKNAATARARGAARLRRAFAVALTGTPIENRSEELWSLLRAVTPGLLGSERRFSDRFVGPIEDRVQGAREALARLVRPFVLRRTKAEVAPELPPRTEVVIRVPLSADEVALYERVRLEAVVRTSEQDGNKQRFEIFRWLTLLRQQASHPRLVDPGSPVGSSKLEMLRRRIADLRGSGHRALVFSQFVRHLELVREALQGDGVSCLWLTGESSEAERQRQVAAFQEGRAEVFLISLGAGGTGLNLTAATYVFHLDPWWNPAKEDQASDRAHRIGQTQPVTVYRLVAEGTLEERILALHDEKRELADALLSGADGAARVSTEELISLLAEAGSAATPDRGGSQ